MTQTQQVKIPLIEVFADAFAAALARHGVLISVTGTERKFPPGGSVVVITKENNSAPPGAQTGRIPSAKPNASAALRSLKPPKKQSDATAKRFARGGAADGRRLPAETLAEAKAFAAYVSKCPGQSIRETGTALKMKTADLAGPVAKALKLGLVRKEGERSLTKYFPPAKKSSK